MYNTNADSHRKAEGLPTHLTRKGQTPNYLPKGTQGATQVAGVATEEATLVIPTP